MKFDEFRQKYLDIIQTDILSKSTITPKEAYELAASALERAIAKNVPSTQPAQSTDWIDALVKGEQYAHLRLGPLPDWSVVEIRGRQLLGKGERRGEYEDPNKVMQVLLDAGYYGPNNREPLKARAKHLQNIKELPDLSFWVFNYQLPDCREGELQGYIFVAPRTERPTLAPLFKAEPSALLELYKKVYGREDKFAEKLSMDESYPHKL